MKNVIKLDLLHHKQVIQREWCAIVDIFFNMIIFFIRLFDRRTDTSNGYIPGQLQNGSIWFNTNGDFLDKLEFILLSWVASFWRAFTH